MTREASTDREDIFTGTVRRGAQGDLLAWVRARGTRRARPPDLQDHAATGPTRAVCVAESVGTVSSTPAPLARRVGPMRERHVVIVAFDGLQPLDAVGPHEVFTGAARAAAALGRTGPYGATIASRRGPRTGGERPRAGQVPRQQNCWNGPPAARRPAPARPRSGHRARANTASNIASVSGPVKVFCWLGWYSRAGRGRRARGTRPGGRRRAGRERRSGRPGPSRRTARAPPRPGPGQQGQLAGEIGQAGVALGRRGLVGRRGAPHGRRDPGAGEARPSSRAGLSGWLA